MEVNFWKLGVGSWWWWWWWGGGGGGQAEVEGMVEAGLGGGLS